MKNITLSIDEAVLRKVRRIAAERDTSVNGLVRDYLTRLAGQQDRTAQARKALLELAEASTWDPGADWKWNREDAYEGRLLPRHQRPAVRRNDDAAE